MPIEIRELVISARIDPCDESSQKQNSSSGTTASMSQEEIIRICIQEVLRVLEDRQER